MIPIILALAGLRIVTPFAWAPCHTSDPNRWAVCQHVAAEARRQGVSERLAVALSWHESRWTDARSPHGAVGPMQVMPQFLCPRGRMEGCDTVAVGVGYLGTLTRRLGVAEGLCRYNAGNKCDRASRGFARAVMATARVSP